MQALFFVASWTQKNLRRPQKNGMIFSLANLPQNLCPALRGRSGSMLGISAAVLLPPAIFSY